MSTCSEFRIDAISEKGLDCVNAISATGKHDILRAVSTDQAQRILDLGCGYGWVLRGLRGKNRHVTGLGVDYRLDAVEKARSLAQEAWPRADLKFVLGDILLEDIKGNYDLVVMLGSIHAIGGIDELPLFLRERRVDSPLYLIGERVINDSLPEALRAYLVQCGYRDLSGFHDVFAAMGISSCDVVYSGGTIQQQAFKRQLTINLESWLRNNRNSDLGSKIHDRLSEYKEESALEDLYTKFNVWLIERR